MKKQSRKLTSFLLAAMMALSLLPAVAFAAVDRAVVSNVAIASENGEVTPVYGAPTDDNPVLTVTTGAPAYCSTRMCGWRKLVEGSYRDCEDAFVAGTYCYYVQVRIDEASGTTHMLDEDNLRVTVDGEEWVVSSVYVFDNVSWANVYSPQFVVTLPEGLPLAFHDSSAFDIDENYADHAITPFSVAANVEGGTAPYAFSKVSGPAWISVSSAGEVSGTPTAPGENENLVVKVRDAKGAEKTITIAVGDTTLDPSDRSKVSVVAIRSESGDITPEYGAPTDDDPVLTVVAGAPAYCSTTMCGWRKPVEGGYGDCEETFVAGTYCYYVQVRIDEASGTTHMLDEDDLRVTVDGEEWVVSSVYVFDNVSWANVYSPPFVLETVPAISSLDVKGIVAPVAGNTAVTTGITINGGDVITVSSAKWWKQGRFSLVELGDSETFKAGVEYYLIIDYAVQEGYAVSDSAGISHDLAGGIAGHNASTRRVAITYTVPESYSVTVTTDGNGTASATPTIAGKGVKVTLTATPKAGYELDAWKIIRPVVFTLPGNTFTMPNDDVVVKAIFKKKIAIEGWKRLAGSNRFLTAQAIAQEGFSGTGGVAVIATGLNYADALAATSLAGVYKAPVLLTMPGYLSAEAAEELDRLAPSKVIVVGGAGVVSDAVIAEVKGMLPGVAVDRVWGANRFDTSAAVYRYIENNPDVSWSGDVILATGLSFADALAVSPYAYWSRTPILLVNPAQGLGAEAAGVVLAGDADDRFGRVIAVGGVGCVSEAAYAQLEAAHGSDEVLRLAGSDRFATGAEVAKFAASEGMSYDGAGVATGMDFPDALAGAALCGAKGSVLLLVNGTGTNLGPAGELLAANAGYVFGGYVFGGEGAVLPAIVALLTQAIQ